VYCTTWSISCGQESEKVYTHTNICTHARKWNKCRYGTRINMNHWQPIEKWLTFNTRWNVVGQRTEWESENRSMKKKFGGLADSKKDTSCPLHKWRNACAYMQSKFGILRCSARTLYTTLHYSDWKSKDLPNACLWAFMNSIAYSRTDSRVNF